jgi:hypothetical protein
LTPFNGGPNGAESDASAAQARQQGETGNTH